jgi:hypothetical protein
MIAHSQVPGHLGVDAQIRMFPKKWNSRYADIVSAQFFHFR